MTAPTIKAANENHEARATLRAAVSAFWRASRSASGLDAAAAAEASAAWACCFAASSIPPPAPWFAVVAPTVAVVAATLPTALAAPPIKEVIPYATSKIITAHASNPCSHPSTGAHRPAKYDPTNTATTVVTITHTPEPKPNPSSGFR